MESNIILLKSDLVQYPSNEDLIASNNNYIKSSAPSPPRTTFSRQTHSVPPQTLQETTIATACLFNNELRAPISHSMSLQKTLSPISSCNGSGLEDEDETLYALNSSRNDESYSQIQDVVSEDDICDFSYRDDFSIATNNSEMPSNVLIVRRNSNGQIYPPIPPKPNKIINLIEIPVFVLQKVLMRLSYNEVFFLFKTHFLIFWNNF